MTPGTDDFSRSSPAAVVAAEDEEDDKGVDVEQDEKDLEEEKDADGVTSRTAEDDAAGEGEGALDDGECPFDDIRLCVPMGTVQTGGKAWGKEAVSWPDWKPFDRTLESEASVVDPVSDEVRPVRELVTGLLLQFTIITSHSSSEGGEEEYGRVEGAVDGSKGDFLGEEASNSDDAVILGRGVTPLRLVCEPADDAEADKSKWRREVVGPDREKAVDTEPVSGPAE